MTNGIIFGGPIMLDMDAVDKLGRARRAAADKANLPKPEDPQEEYNRLVQWGDSLGTRLSGSERTINRAADRVKGFEEKIKNMKTYAATQNPKAQKPWAEKIADSENDLAGAKRFLEAQVRVNKALAEEQRSFPTDRLAELRKLIRAEDEMYRLVKKRVSLG